MVPGVETFGAALNPSPGTGLLLRAGGPVGEGRFNVNGMPVANAFAGGGGSSLIYDTVNVDEIAFTIAGGMGETDIGGPVLNIVPRSGGNAFQGQAFTNFSNDRLRGRQSHAGADGADAWAEPPRDAWASSRRTTPTSPMADPSCAIACGSTAAIGS